MSRAIRKHLRDFLAIIFLVVVAAGVAGYILSNQRFYLPAWVPVVGTDFYKVEAELETAQAVVPGQGQTVNIAGVKVGDIGRVRAGGRPRGGGDEDPARVRADLQGRDDPAAAEDRPQGHVPRARPGQPRGRASSRRGSACRWPTRSPTSTPTRSSRRWTATRATTCGCCSARAPRRCEGDAPAELRQTLQALRADGARHARATKLLIDRRQQHPPRDHTTSSCWPPSSATRTASSRRSIDSANANFEAIAAQDANLREALRLLPGRARGDPRRRCATSDALAGDLGPALQQAAPRRPRARPRRCVRRGRSCAPPRR